MLAIQGLRQFRNPNVLLNKSTRTNPDIADENLASKSEIFLARKRDLARIMAISLRSVVAGVPYAESGIMGLRKRMRGHETVIFPE